MRQPGIEPENAPERSKATPVGGLPRYQLPYDDAETAAHGRSFIEEDQLCTAVGLTTLETLKPKPPGSGVHTLVRKVSMASPRLRT